MSVTFVVYTRSIPENLEAAWLGALRSPGFRCELRPGTRLLAEDHETGPYLKVEEFPSASPRTFPGVALLAGFGLSAADVAASNEDLPPAARGASHRVIFFTAAGRQPIDYALQLLGAAALALVTDGLFEDPQRGETSDGPAAIERAIREIRAMDLEDGSLPWVEWPPESFDDELEYEFPLPLVVPKRESWLQRKLGKRIR